jgi:hypothetical protein
VDSAAWRPYRRHLIVARTGRLLGRCYWDVWHRGSVVGTFDDVVSAELHVDARLREITG